MADNTVIYSKRYPQEREKIRALVDQFKESEGGKEETEKKLREFWEKMETESVYIPIPGWENKSKCFIALAKKMSQIYELDIDIETERVQKCAVKRAAELLREDAALEFRRCHEHGAAAVKAYRLKLAEPDVVDRFGVCLPEIVGDYLPQLVE